MFGYVRPAVKELKVKEHDLYKSAYCGLCRVMGKRYSYAYKMSLSYDFVFMVLLRIYVSGEKVSFSQKRCFAHPTSKKVMMDENPSLDVSADAGLIMLYNDFLDKKKDRDGFKSFACSLALPKLKRLRKKACRYERLSEFDLFAQEKLAKLSEIESQNAGSVDLPSEEFGSILGEALSLGLDGPVKRTVFEIGRNMGKWIYVTDAVDDLDRDEKRGAYNPLLAFFGSSAEAKKNGEMIALSLLNNLADAHRALDLLDNTDPGIYNILDNIIRIGSVNTHNEILKKNNFQTTDKENKEDD